MTSMKQSQLCGTTGLFVLTFFHICLNFDEVEKNVSTNGYAQPVNVPLILIHLVNFDLVYAWVKLRDVLKSWKANYLSLVNDF